MKLPTCMPTFLLPDKSVDLNKFAVVACDQFTSQPEYWERLDEYVGEKKSALRLILPECYLGTDVGARIAAASAACDEYLGGGVFDEYCGYVRVTRTLSGGKTREGLVMLLDLNEYDFDPEKKAKVRATEGTVTERIPPRVRVREQMSLEFPHVMLLYSDPTDSVMRAARQSETRELYDFELNMGGGRLRGGLIEDGDAVERALGDVYGGNPFYMAVGDGNHSLATAKRVYENTLLAGGDVSRCRYALVEAVNLYDSGLEFEPIHRAVFGAGESFIEGLRKRTRGMGGKTKAYCGGREYAIDFPAGAVDGVRLVEDYIAECGMGGQTDYIHGADSLKKLGGRDDCAAIELQPMNKSELFDYVLKHGVLPKKTFSMGEAQDKRYYLESRRIK